MSTSAGTAGFGGHVQAACRAIDRRLSRLTRDRAPGLPGGGVIKDPEAGDFVRLNGKIISVHEGSALVEVYRSDPVGLRIPVQCGALEHVEPAADDDPVRGDIPNAEEKP